MTKLATIQKIHSIQPHPNPEVNRLEVGLVKAWPVVIPKGEFKDGELVVFITIDSIVPENNPYFEFMRKQHFRVWNAKFKKAPSQGLVCPLSILPDSCFGVVGDKDMPLRPQEGDDVTDALNITKYEKGLDALIAGDAKGGFPTNLISITDEDNLLNYPEILNEFQGENCYITLKADGSSMTAIYDNGEVRVCSRRLEQKEGTGFWKLAEKYDLPNKLKFLGKNIAIQAEACGGKIQGNPLGLTDQTMFIFNVKETDTGKWYNWDELKELCFIFKISPVLPIMENFVFHTEHMTINELQNIANATVYKTSKGETKPAEGIVLRPTTPKYSTILGKSLSVKILNQDYK